MQRKSNTKRKTKGQKLNSNYNTMAGTIPIRNIFITEQMSFKKPIDLTGEMI
jgi:hypothetical protein